MKTGELDFEALAIEAREHRRAVKDACLDAVLVLAVRPELVRQRNSAFWFSVNEAKRRLKSASELDGRGAFPTTEPD